MLRTSSTNFCNELSVKSGFIIISLLPSALFIAFENSDLSFSKSLSCDDVDVLIIAFICSAYSLNKLFLKLAVYDFV